MNGIASQTNLSIRLLYVLILASLLLSCSGFRNKVHKNSITFPDLGSIVYSKNKLLRNSVQQVGQPTWQSPHLVTVQQLPFNKASYNVYLKHMVQSSKMSDIPYNDSLPFKPKYLRLQLLNKIKMTSELNNENNSEVSSYLKNDEDYKIVTTLNFTATDKLLRKLLSADEVVLQNSNKENNNLKLINGKQSEIINFSYLEVFSYELSSFCWGVDKMKRAKIKAIYDDREKCSNGTFKKALKAVKDSKAYLKF